MVASKTSRGSAFLLFSAGVACSEPVDVDVQLVDPCNQEALTTVDYLRFEPRGSGIDSFALSTVELVPGDAPGGQAADIELPLAPDFQLLVTGHEGSIDADAPPSALGLSSTVDLSAVESSVSIRLPMSRLGQFHRTTDLTASAEATNRCSALARDRFGASATVLPGGEVLIVGGARYADGFLEVPRRVEVYDPRTGTFRDRSDDSSRTWELGAGQARRRHTATLLSDGRVLVAGGQAPDPQRQGSETALLSAFIIDARNPQDVRIPEGGFTMLAARTGHRATALPDGRVVLVGGRQLTAGDSSLEGQTYLDSVEVYDSSAGAFLLATDGSGNALTLAEARFGHSAIAIPGSVDVLVAGGFNALGPVRTVEVLRFIAGSPVRIPASGGTDVGAIYHSATLTQDGTVLLSGGYSTLEDVRSRPPVGSARIVEMWAVDVATGRAERICQDELTVERGQHTSSIVGRRAIFIGGRDANGRPRSDGEVADLRSLGEIQNASSGCFTANPTLESMTDARAEHEAVVLPASREVLILGGVQQDPAQNVPGATTATAEIFSDFARRGLVSTPTP
ncbi:MAG: kelch repeat-containing protein [Myxococcota bacterium]